MGVRCSEFNVPFPSLIVDSRGFYYVPRVNRLTRHEQTVLSIVFGLLLIGWAVKAYRTAHPTALPASEAPITTDEQAKK